MSANLPMILFLAILTLATIFFFGVAGFCFVKTIIFLRCSRKRIGIVVGQSSDINSEGEQVFMPIVAFQTLANERYRVTGKIGTYKPQYQDGERLTVRYLPEQPEKAVIQAFSNLYFLPLLFLALGAITAFGANITYLSLIR